MFFYILMTLFYFFLYIFFNKKLKPNSFEILSLAYINDTLLKNGIFGSVSLFPLSVIIPKTTLYSLGLIYSSSAKFTLPYLKCFNFLSNAASGSFISFSVVEMTVKPNFSYCLILYFLDFVYSILFELKPQCSI